MMDPRPFGLIVVVVGLIGTLIAAFADPLGLGEGQVFGWLQLTGVIVGGVVTLLGLAIAMEWVPYPARRADTTTSSSQNTTVIE
jgi:hypothetical protein